MVDAEACGFVCVCNGGRDAYGVPIGLYRQGVLRVFVTDYVYKERGFLHRALAPRSLKESRAAEFPDDLASNTYSSLIAQALARLAGVDGRIFFAGHDFLLSLKAGAICRLGENHIFAYAGYLPPDWLISKERARIVFQYHPHWRYVRQILEEDRDRFAGEIRPPSKLLADNSDNDDWKRADVVVCASSFTKESLLAQGCEAEKLRVIPYGARDHALRTTYERDGTCRFLFVGQGVRRKGLHVLLLAWRRARLRRATLTVVSGNVDAGMRALADGDIRWLSRQPEDQLFRLYAQADAFVMPSLVEGFGLVYLEALSSGCHVIGTGNTGLPDLRLSEASCTCVQPGNIGALASALEDVEQKYIRAQLDRVENRAEGLRRPFARFTDEIGDLAREVVQQKSQHARLRPGAGLDALSGVRPAQRDGT